MDSDNRLPPLQAPFITITFTPIVILSHTQRNGQTPEPFRDTALLGFIAALFGAPTNTSGLQGQPPASEAAMKAQRVLNADQVPNGATCCVCIEELFQTGEQRLSNTVRCMPCNHAYHETCLFTWLKQSATCPTCRYEIESDNVEWNAASRRRTAERDQRTREMREEQEQQRRASRRENNQSACGLVNVGCCEFVDDELVHVPDSAFAEKKNIVLLPCNHSFHRNCLVTNLHVQGQDVSNGDSNVEVRCPCCRKTSSIPAEELRSVMPKSTADDRPPGTAGEQGPGEASSVPTAVVSTEVLPATILPEELETD